MEVLYIGSLNRTSDPVAGECVYHVVKFCL